MAVEDIFAEPGTSPEPRPQLVEGASPMVVPPIHAAEQDLPPSNPKKRGILWVVISIVVLLVGFGTFLGWRYFWSDPQINATLIPIDLNLLPEEEVEIPVINSTIVNQAPTSPDKDKDGLTQEEEVSFGTSDQDSDSDDDGLNDKEEIKIYKTNPNDPDTDGDTYLDGDEVKNLYNPNGPGKLFSLENIQT